MHEIVFSNYYINEKILLVFNIIFVKINTKLNTVIRQISDQNKTNILKEKLVLYKKYETR